ncbi:hypothetical protein [Pseudooceanicola sp. LIPI14-2-Ac024]|uniref:hypothetical protein n=1 Tax=Pseudooceanicola sp. LIPI14-2-Ac024 TaxID=3344875 RepID=UPI0035CF67C8
MLKTATTAMGLIFASSLAVQALDRPFPVSEVQVTTELENVSVSDVTNFYPAFNEDLEKAIWSQIENPQNGGRGFEIDVKVTEVALDDGALGPDGKFNNLDGIVTYTFQGADQPSGTFPIEVTAQSGEAPAGAIVVMPSEADFYQAMVMAFAAGVNDKMADLAPPQDDAVQQKN